jgi:hypothetical protein
MEARASSRVRAMALGQRCPPGGCPKMLASCNTLARAEGCGFGSARAVRALLVLQHLQRVHVRTRSSPWRRDVHV